jgi:transcriptional regulator with XRE-family HTH domain
MHRSHLSLAIAYERSTNRLTQESLAASLGIAQSTVAQYTSGRRSPDDEGLRRLCTLWPDARGGLRLLLAHLQDRIEIAGRAGEVECHASESPAAAHDIESAMAIIRAEASRYEDVRQLLLDLAALIRRADAMPSSSLRVAEPGLEYVASARPAKSDSRPRDKSRREKPS